ncbi:MAG TPA: serine acetyltransferase [Kofleriaceae bacterium]|nr:serine acetyltransferase [Kofleriaceae bacterium]
MKDDVVERLMTSYRTASGAMQHVNAYELPSMENVGEIVEQARSLLFPGFVGRSLARVTESELRDYVSERVDDLERLLRRQLYRGLHHTKSEDRREGDCPTCAAKADAITTAFVARLVEVRDALALDVDAHLAGDPAASGSDEIIFCYPGMYAISVYRIANALHLLGARLIPRMMSELAHQRVGIDIHPGATIGRSFFIDHGTGVVIGETSVIGDRVRIYQGVTLGALTVHGRHERGVKRHPTIEDDVVIYAGATILGGDTVIGKGAVIGGNCWVTASVAPGEVVVVERRSASRRPER